MAAVVLGSSKHGDSPADFDVVIVGAGASGLMCAIHAGRRGLRVLVLEKGPKPGLKILVSGGGRCNFTNLWAEPEDHYLSENQHFCISAMRRYPVTEFIDMVNAHGIAYHEKKLGQLFCDHSAQDIVDMLLHEAEKVGVQIRLKSEVSEVVPYASGFRVNVATSKGKTAIEAYALDAPRVVLASGGLSLPKIASDLAYRTARDLGMSVVAPSPALVPLTWNNADKAEFAALSGVAVDCEITCCSQSFRENLLFTHRGLSGPAILQASSYWRPGDDVNINLLPALDVLSWLRQLQQDRGKMLLSTALKNLLPNRLIEAVIDCWFDDQILGDMNAVQCEQVARCLQAWRFRPGGTEGYRTAEVTLGGLATTEFSSKSFEAKGYPGLYAIGEALDVTGWLGGYNFQWAWASGYCCAQNLSS
ncbi:MAG: aminoacetone oxidase family FAD-binding enzyme [Marinovum sp.]|nr:aminoacetone oxidase family FAD-binding enzyme [Marinovum sp.]